VVMISQFPLLLTLKVLQITGKAWIIVNT